MTLQSVRDFLARHAPDLQIVEKPISTATVAEAASAHAVEPARIAKTLSLRLKEEVILLVMCGDARIDNQKFKARFKAKARMLGPEEVVEVTGHPVGGVCPFGLPGPLKVFVDQTLSRFDEIIPAAGATNASLRIAPDRLVDLAHAEWVDVAQTSDG